MENLLHAVNDSKKCLGESFLCKRFRKEQHRKSLRSNRRADTRQWSAAQHKKTWIQLSCNQKYRNKEMHLVIDFNLRRATALKILEFQQCPHCKTSESGQGPL